LYPREAGSEGGVGVWDGTGTKPQVDYDLDSKSAFFKWVAGWVIVDREMLDDILFLTSYLQNKLLIDLKRAENDFVLNGTSDTNPVEGLIPTATAYDGALGGVVDRIIDSAYGQIPEVTNDFYTGNIAVLHPRDIVKVGLNKADGSGEYDLPQDSVKFSNGVLNVGGLNAVSTTGITKNEFLTFDRSSVMFLRRMNPEIQMFVDSELAKKNKVMFRVEERVTQIIFNTDALVKGDFTVTP
jgi:HK97 family phage major capsid protein